MTSDPPQSKITLFDTTLRDGELTPGVKMTIPQKIRIAQLLEQMQVDVIEVGYPGAFRKDSDELLMVSKQIKQATVCGLAGSKLDEVIDVALAIRPAAQGRIHIFTPVGPLQANAQETLDLIHDSVKRLGPPICQKI